MKKQHYEIQDNAELLNKQNVIFIYGEEAFLKDRMVALALSRILDARARALDFVQLFCSESSSASSILEELEMMPFLSEKRIVLAKDMDKLRLDEKKKIAAYCADASPCSILILTAEKPDMRTAAYKQIMNKALAIECKKPRYDKDMLNFLRGEIKTRKLTMNADTLQLFSRYLQMDFQTASNEIDKLVIMAQGKHSISMDMVRECVGKSRQYSVFEFQNAMGDKNIKAASYVLENILQADEKGGIYLISILSRFFYIIWRINAYRQKNYGDSEISTQYLKDITPYFRKDYLAYARNFSLISIRKIFNYLLQSDTEMKTSDTKHTIIMSVLVFRICRG